MARRWMIDTTLGYDHQSSRLTEPAEDRIAHEPPAA
jgi:hypothetical protein